MPIRYDLLPLHSAMLVKAEGRLSLEEILAFLARVVSDPMLPDPHVTLFDATGVTELDLTPGDLSEVTAYTAENASKIVAQKLALVVRGSEEAVLADHYQRLAKSVHENTVVFFSRCVALVWLGLPEDV